MFQGYTIRLDTEESNKNFQLVQQIKRLKLEPDISRIQIMEIRSIKTRMKKYIAMVYTNVSYVFLTILHTSLHIKSNRYCKS
jgi:hypothetical protein